MEDVKIGEILEPVGPGENREREERVRAKFWRTVKKAARQVPFMEELVAGYYCALDNDTPPKVRGILLAALAYFVLPLDVVPDFLLGFGFTDDVAVLAAALNAVRRHITPAHRIAARQALTETERDV
ncbi:YkvA family protein [Nitratireductor rhodophyticola]|uniref:YkvA family protein n=1 Tax=Nitratireductor rhodophyticola TaxID=2854036 RepID=UPI002AC9E058|nr:YkvA family protein [Nitratireductor rhodophyticola]WPZ15454.1 YkvA family protein [Nitratireductor rhodophyticola]